MKTSVILLSGGKGLRMGGSVPKQYLKLHGIEVALYSFRLFESMPRVEEIIVVAEPEYQYLFASERKPVKYALPGARRQDSLKQGMELLSSDAELICVHDAARPLVTFDEVSRVLEAGEKFGAAALGVPVKATLKKVQNGLIACTVDRSDIWEIQTPQVVKRTWLEEGMAHATAQQLNVTDDVGLAELLGRQVKAVEGSSCNLKVTTPEDLKMASALIKTGAYAL